MERRGRINHLVIKGDQLIKENKTHPEIITAELAVYRYLAENAPDVKIPKIIQDSESIIMEFLKDGRPSTRQEIMMALSVLHSHRATYYGFPTDTYQGFLKVDNTATNSWSSYFKRRFIALRDHITTPDSELYWQIQCLTDINLTDPVPSLLHGDANPGNFITVEKTVYIIDPACFYGDPLFDIACYDVWTRDRDKDLTLQKAIYYTYILLYTQHLTNSKSQMKNAVKYLNYCLSTAKACYPSAIIPTPSPTPMPSQRTVLVQGGSYNPAHRNHIRNMNLASDQFDCSKVIKVFSLASDRRVISKKPKICLSFGQRWRVLEKTIKEFSTPITENNLIDLSCCWGHKLVENLNSIWAEPQIHIVMGTDVVQYNDTVFPLEVPFIIVARKGYKLKKLVSERKIILIQNNDEIKVSSTAIRADPKKYGEMTVIDAVAILEKKDTYDI